MALIKIFSRIPQFMRLQGSIRIFQIFPDFFFWKLPAHFFQTPYVGDSLPCQVPKLRCSEAIKLNSLFMSFRFILLIKTTTPEVFPHFITLLLSFDDQRKQWNLFLVLEDSNLDILVYLKIQNFPTCRQHGPPISFWSIVLLWQDKFYLLLFIRTISRF